MAKVDAEYAAFREAYRAHMSPASRRVTTGERFEFLCRSNWRRIAGVMWRAARSAPPTRCKTCEDTGVVWGKACNCEGVTK